MYHGDAKETFDPDPWLVPLPSLRRGIPATPSTGALGLLGVVWCSLPQPTLPRRVGELVERPR